MSVFIPFLFWQAIPSSILCEREAQSFLFSGAAQAETGELWEHGHQTGAAPSLGPPLPGTAPEGDAEEQSRACFYNT